ncbi:MAG: pseudouridine synthase [Synergistaceae bacterium]|jgi:23S rRNA pseudouridine2605 synthase|nr:pseudouridine synthase [Synergistaceae bacterium]
MSEEGGCGFPVRLNRYLAVCGICARRKADVLIASGRVTVEGVAETSPGRVLDRPLDVRVDGRAAVPVRRAYIVMNKPSGVLSAVSDARERTVLDLLPDSYRPLGLYPVGRLDKDSEGLIVLTNDGKFARELIHPSRCVERTYFVTLRRALRAEKLDEWRSGVIIEGRLFKPIEVTDLDGPARGLRFKVVLGEGVKREIRLMAASLGSSVEKLQRVGIGRLFLKKLPRGAFYEYNHKKLRDMISRGGEV